MEGYNPNLDHQPLIEFLRGTSVSENSPHVLYLRQKVGDKRRELDGVRSWTRVTQYYTSSGLNEDIFEDKINKQWHFWSQQPKRKAVVAETTSANTGRVYNQYTERRSGKPLKKIKKYNPFKKYKVADFIDVDTEFTIKAEVQNYH